MKISRLIFLNKLYSIKFLLKKINNVRIFKKAFFKIGKEAIVNGGGLLVINSNYKRMGHQSSSFILMHNSQLNIKGEFDLFYGADIQVFPKAVLSLGSGYSNINLMIRCNKSITIGNNVMIAHNVTIFDSNFHEFTINGKKKEKDAGVVIEDGVWIGANTVILKGVTIGKGAIIGAGSLVRDSIPEHCLACGNPCKVISTNVSIKEKYGDFK